VGYNTHVDRDQLAVVTLAGVVGGLVLIHLSNPMQTFSVNALLDPNSVHTIAEQIPYTSDDEYLLSAWQKIGGEIPYEPIGSEMIFSGNTVKCLKCFLGQEVIYRNRGNCVAKSSLLGSILLNHIPPERVKMVIGVYQDDADFVGEGNGHAWLEYKRASDNRWYLIEATQAPRGFLPVENAPEYVPHAVITGDGTFQCNDPELCVAMPKFNPACNCGNKPFRYSIAF
jgi:hypothetical protein